MIVLIMGLPGSGKTTLAHQLKKQLELESKTVEWFNADAVRKTFNDWDFSREGRIRQATRMSALANTLMMNVPVDYIILDFVAPLQEMRDIVKPDYLVWIDTIEEGRFEDTNKMFERPMLFDCRVTEKDATKWANIIKKALLSRSSVL